MRTLPKEKRRFAALLPTLLAAPLLAGALAACSGGQDAALSVVVIGTPDAPFAAGARLSEAGGLVRAATAEGLVAFDEQGRVVPALADRWIITDDGLSYIFRLRDGTWPDGSPLTAISARSALREAILAQRDTPLAPDLGGLEDIRVMAGRVIELRLGAPNPDLLQILAQPELGLAHKGKGAGPMRLARAGQVATLTPIPPGARGLPDVEGWSRKVRAIHLSALPAPRAVEVFRSGEADLVLGGGFRDFPLTGGLGLARGSVQADPVIGLFGLIVVHDDGFLATPEHREAIAMAIDREALAGAMGISGWTLSSRIVSPGMEGDIGTIGERWVGSSLADRQATAAARVARWSGPQPVRLRIALPAGPGADVLFQRLAQDLRAAGFQAVRVGEGAAADLRLIDAVARYARASWFLGQLGCAARQSFARGLCSESADMLAEQARRTGDPQARASLLAEAEAELTAANVYIPIGAPLRWSLVRGSGIGFAANRFALHPLMPMARLPK